VEDDRGHTGRYRVGGHIFDAEMPNACVFCGDDSNALTDEHVFGDWIAELFGRDVEGVSQVVTADGSVKHWPSTGFSDVVKVVCKRCNETWMNDMELAVQPTLGPMMTKGWATTLSVPTQRHLAAWAIKTALVMDHLHPKHRVVPESMYSALYDAKAPLSEAHVWMARRNDWEGMWATSLAEHIDQVQISNDDPEFAAAALKEIEGAMARGERMFRVTFGIGFVVFQVLGSTLPVLGEIYGGSGLVSMVQRIWPNNGQEITWPPAESVDSIGGVEGLHRTWGGEGRSNKAIAPPSFPRRPRKKRKKGRKEAKQQRKDRQRNERKKRR
jgi:hypothetical protein